MGLEYLCRFVKIFADTVKPIVGRCRLSTHLCFGNYKGRAVAPRRYAPLFPVFFELPVNEIHLEMASREFAEIELVEEIAKRGIDVAVGIIDVKNYYVETPADVADPVRLCLKYAPADRLSFAPDCGLSQTARWAARQKLITWSRVWQSCARSWGSRDPSGAVARRAARRHPRRGPE